MNAARILIIDDDPMLGEQLRSLVSILGHRAVCCGDATRALNLLETNTYDLIFCDYWLPDPSGQNFFQQVIQRMPELGPSFVFLTGGVLGDETQFFIRSSGNLQLLKPFKLPAVRQVLAAAFQPAPALASPTSTLPRAT